MQAMKKAEMKDQIFEVMLKSAVEENFQRELQELPREKDLSEDYELSPPAREKIEKMIREARRHSCRLRIGKIAKRAAVVAAVVIPISVGSLLSVEASRNAIFNALMDWKPDHVDTRYQNKGVSSDASSSASGYSIIKPKYLPEGFFEARTVQTESDFVTQYRNEKGEEILLRESPLTKEGTFGVDTEHTTRKDIMINGVTASLFVANPSGGKSYLVWRNHTSSFYLSSEIPWEQLVKMAKSVEK